MTICERMFQLIDSKPNKNAAGLCRVLGVGTAQTSNWKSRNVDPPAKYLEQICEYLDVSIEYLVTGTDKELTQEENTLLLRFRSLDEEGKEEVLHAALSEIRRMRNDMERGSARA